MLSETQLSLGPFQKPEQSHGLLTLKRPFNGLLKMLIQALVRSQNAIYCFFEHLRSTQQADSDVARYHNAFVSEQGTNPWSLHRRCDSTHFQLGLETLSHNLGTYRQQSNYNDESWLGTLEAFYIVENRFHNGYCLELFSW